MKKTSHISLVALFVATISIACTKIDAPQNNGDEGPPQERKYASTLVTPEMALQNAERFISSFEPAVKSGISRTISSLHICGRESMPTKADTASVAGPPDSPFLYIANFDNNRGFCVIPGDTRLPEVLIYVDEGQLMPGDTIDNPGLAMYLDMADYYYRTRTGMPITDIDTGISIFPDDPRYPVEFIITPPLEIAPEVTYEYTDWKQIACLGAKDAIDIKWHQRSPFNKYCLTASGEKAKAGCVPIAVAQLMYYHGKDINYSGIEFDWDLMRTVTDAYSGTDEAQDMVATLIRQLGNKENLNAKYGTGSTSTSEKGLGRTFKNFGYSHRGSFVRYDSDKGLGYGPMLGSGFAIRNTHKWTIFGFTILQWSDYENGHFWVISHKITMKREKKKFENGDYVSSTYEKRKYVHCNWGWIDGENNGYYYDEVFDASDEGGPTDPYNPETKSGTENYYQYDVKMYYGARP